MEVMCKRTSFASEIYGSDLQKGKFCKRNIWKWCAKGQVLRAKYMKVMCKRTSFASEIYGSDLQKGKFCKRNISKWSPKGQVLRAKYMEVIFKKAIFASEICRSDLQKGKFCERNIWKWSAKGQVLQAKYMEVIFKRASFASEIYGSFAPFKALTSRIQESYSGPYQTSTMQLFCGSRCKHCTILTKKHHHAYLRSWMCIYGGVLSSQYIPTMAYSKFCQTTKVEHSAKIVNTFW